jgi:propanediol dehydratase small subunit
MRKHGSPELREIAKVVRSNGFPVEASDWDRAADMLEAAEKRIAELGAALREIAMMDPHYAMPDDIIERAKQRLAALDGGR